MRRAFPSAVFSENPGSLFPDSSLSGGGGRWVSVISSIFGCRWKDTLPLPSRILRWNVPTGSACLCVPHADRPGMETGFLSATSMCPAVSVWALTDFLAAFSGHAGKKSRHAASPLSRYGHPGLRSLHVACASPTNPPAADRCPAYAGRRARLHGTTGPSPSSPTPLRGFTRRLRRPHDRNAPRISRATRAGI